MSRESESQLNFDRSGRTLEILRFISAELWCSLNKLHICVELGGWELGPWLLCRRQTPDACILGGGTATLVPRIQNGFTKIFQMSISK
ncbi:hypothetical protein L1987_86025 [Smallanthus sonchifolius]|uniref:Uncharacterized protein n=1 Tax=Smallanthus sonchifolius TaxID=185202 RepID=A0ACB8XY79_9ASTR|nr:hypothetical protein L1987_86025 [Smallanthus sonchifolius]